jgi:predicted nucleic acid-binding protein
MMRVALDTNILIYAEFEPESDRGKRAADLILRAARDGVIPMQVLGEYLRFVQRRLPTAFAEAVRQASIYRTLFLTPPTTNAIFDKGCQLALAHRIQFWDCMVCAVSIEAGAIVLLTEDMQDGRLIEGLRLMNPFASENADAIAALWID